MDDSGDRPILAVGGFSGIGTMVIAHRGASAVCPENTLEAFRRAAELGADWVEFDVRRTADGSLVVHHDAVLPDGRVIVELDREQLPKTVPSLIDTLDACGTMGINAEIKNDPSDPDFDPDDHVAEQLADLFVRRAATSSQAGIVGTDLSRVLVTSFNQRTIAAVHSRASIVPTGWLRFELADPAAAIAEAASQGHTAINPWYPTVDAAFMTLATDAGLRVFPWTVDDPVRIAELRDLGVDGVITNVVDTARSVIDLHR